jgi:hypothetical protein
MTVNKLVVVDALQAQIGDSVYIVFVFGDPATSQMSALLFGHEFPQLPKAEVKELGQCVHENMKLNVYRHTPGQTEAGGGSTDGTQG